MKWLSPAWHRISIFWSLEAPLSFTISGNNDGRNNSLSHLDDCQEKRRFDQFILLCWSQEGSNYLSTRITPSLTCSHVHVHISHVHIGCVSLGNSKIGFLNPEEHESRFCVSLLNRSIQDHSDHSASKKPKNPFWARILRFL